MIPNSFGQELLKQAAPVGFLASLAGVLEKNIPSALSTIRGAMTSAGLGSVTKARMLGGAVGGAAGALAGSKVSDENKGRNTAIGAVAGAAAGAVGLGKLAPRVPTFGVAAGQALKNMGADITAGKVTGKNMLDYMATKWAPRVENLKSTPFTQSDITRVGTQPTGKIGPPGFKQTKAPLAEITDPTATKEAPKGSFVLRHVGELAENAATVQKRGLKGLGNVMAGNIQENKFTSQKIEGKKYLFERTGLGKIVNPGLQSGVGMGAAQFLMSGKDEQGNKKPIGKRLLSSGGTALAWGAAPKLMIGKALAYDLPKSLIGIKKPTPSDIPTQ